jgi:4-hydroxythreonine-4-phosphate dehydrogenase
VAPAFPATGRTTRGGRVFVGEAHVGDLVALLDAAGLKPVRVPRGAPLAGGRTLVCDAETDADLAAIAAGAARLGRPLVWVGSAGLARQLPGALGLVPTTVAPARKRRPPGPVLILVGSRSPVAREQAGRVDAVTIALGPGADDTLEAALAAGDDVVLITPVDHVDLARAPAFAAALGRRAAAHAARLGGLIATGGDIARAALTALGASGLHLVGEIEPGVPRSLADTDPPLPVVTKAGAFGAPTTLERARRELRS